MEKSKKRKQKQKLPLTNFLPDIKQVPCFQLANYRHLFTIVKRLGQHNLEESGRKKDNYSKFPSKYIQLICYYQLLKSQDA